MTENVLDLTIRALDFNLVAKQPELIKQFRKLTLYPYSGLNYELSHLLSLSKYRQVSAQTLLAYYQNNLVAWALMSKEESQARFPSNYCYHSTDGILLEMYVHPNYRRQGIGSKLIKVARHKALPSRLCVVPWDDKSYQFYGKFKHYGAKWL
jgi:GNAT superfamily N-acetyltransferase